MRRSNVSTLRHADRVQIGDAFGVRDQSRRRRDAILTEEEARERRRATHVLHHEERRIDRRGQQAWRHRLLGSTQRLERGPFRRELPEAIACAAP